MHNKQIKPSKALIVWGGWDGHQPELVAELFSDILKEENFETEISVSLDSFKHAGEFNLIVPVFTMGKIDSEQLTPVVQAIESGLGIAGCHGGMCDSFRESTEWQFMTGGQWVAHPGNDGVSYRVNIRRDIDSPITKDIPDFDVISEQYYMHVDPAVRMLATTTFPTPGVDGPHIENGNVEMPVVWTKMYGKGRVFYCSLGHQRNVVEAEPARTLMKRGFLWASK